MIGVRLLTDYTNHPANDSPSVVMWMLDQDLLILMLKLKLGGGLFGEWV